MMIDPITALAGATTAFNTIKKGFEIGRDIESMASDLGRWMSAISDISEAEKQAQNPPIFKKLFFSGSVEEEAMAMFAAKKKAEDQRAQLKVYIMYTMGMGAWEELIAMEGKIRKERQETIYKQAQRRRKFMEIVAILFGCVFFATGFGLIVWFAYAVKNGLL